MVAEAGIEIEIDTDECISAGKCVLAAPELFEFGDDGLAAVRPDGPRLDDAVLVRIARNCPSGAIRLVLHGEPIDLEA